MKLAIHPPLAPMEALSVDTIPVGPEWQYEPKWDGFRCILFRDGDKVEIQSKAGKSLSRYFPEMVTATRGLAAKVFVLDFPARPAAAQRHVAYPTIGMGESLAAGLQRHHPAMARRHQRSPPPAYENTRWCRKWQSLLDSPLRDRPRKLEAFAKRFFPRDGSFRLSPATANLCNTKRWLQRVGSTLDGIIAKRLDMPYRSGDRTGTQKIKNYRSADCVVGGFPDQ